MAQNDQTVIRNTRIEELNKSKRPASDNRRPANNGKGSKATFKTPNSPCRDKAPVR